MKFTRSRAALLTTLCLAFGSTALVAAGSGAFYVTDRFWGDERMMLLHALAGWALAALVPLHLAGVVLTSMRHRENLVRAMIDGHKRPPGPGDVPA